MSVLLPFQLGTLPSGVCFSSEQQRYNAYMSITYAVLQGQAFYNFGPDKPSVDLQAYPWLRTTDGRWYVFNGVWRSPVNYNRNERRLWVGSLTDLQSYDGGDGTAGPITPTSGPMWVEDTSFAGRSPMHPGAIPTSNPAKTLSVAENFGEGAHAQTSTELYPHNHAPSDNFNAFAGFVKPGQSSSYEITGGTEIERMGTTGLQGGNASGNAEPANVIHPVKGAYIIMPSGRAFYTVL